MGLVWAECIRQAHEMRDYWKGVPDIRHTGKDVRRFSLHVLSATGFGKSYPFDPAAEEVPEGGKLTYKDSLHLLLENAILVLLLGPKLLTGILQPYLPKHWSLVGKAASTFKSHIAETIKEEKRLIADGKANPGNFIGAMVRASEEAAEEEYSKGLGRRSNLGLTESEIFGNIFVFNFAGHDSIAITLTYMITHLAAHPEVQDWIAEEIEHVCADQTKDAPAPYRDTFPKLKRCLAVVVSLPPPLPPLHATRSYTSTNHPPPPPDLQYETLRTSTPFPAIVKTTGSAPRTLHINAKPLLLPPGMNIISPFPAIFNHPRYWGPDADTWRPARWIVTPPHGAFLPWADGDRVCPGKKFAQVELVGALSALFADGWRVQPVCEGGEGAEAARGRVKGAIRDSGMVLLVEMLHPERVGLQWVREGGRR
ncbi:hypothetical protein MMC13_007857 [Lambiella insularis]|nr:hypothetical protein [Lambiella insularis]